MIQEELEKIQTELGVFHKELQVLAKFDHRDLLAENLKRFGATLVELESLAETGFIAFLGKTLEAVIKYVENVASLSFKELVGNLLEMADEAKMRAFMEQYLWPHLNKATKASLEHLISIS